MALARAAGARTIVLVEGISDQIAVEALARRYDRDLAGEQIVILPVGGAHGARRYLRQFGPEGAGPGSPGSATRPRSTSCGAAWPRPALARPARRRA